MGSEGRCAGVGTFCWETEEVPSRGSRRLFRRSERSYPLWRHTSLVAIRHHHGREGRTYELLRNSVLPWKKKAAPQRAALAFGT